MCVVLNITETWSVTQAVEMKRCKGAARSAGYAEVGKAGLACRRNSN